MNSTRKITYGALLTAMALGLSYLEAFFPLTMVIPLPGVKIGLANIVTIFALYTFGPAEAFMILLCRCFLGAMFAGNFNALLFSLLGGVCAMLCMTILSRMSHLSIYGVSIGGAAAHNLGQIGAAMISLGNFAPLSYLPFLLLVSIATGAITGLVSSLLFTAMEHIPQIGRV